MSSQDGLEWVEGTFGLEPHWTREPDTNTIAHIARKHLGVSENIPLDVTPHAQGTFNRLYKISTRDTTCLIRVTLPVDPRYKTSSEAATIEFVRQKTSTPVPRIIAFDASNENALGFEWILMEMMPGTTLHKAWRKVSWDTKEEVVRQLVKFQAQLFEHRFQKIGNVYCQNDLFSVDRMVSPGFFQGDRLTQNVSRGPFASSYEWLKTRLQLVLNDQQRVLSTSCDEDELEDAEFAHDLTRKLFEILPTVFLSNVSASEPSTLFHDDVSMHDILVDTDGKLTAIVDWECVSAVPLWRACQLPQLLVGPNRDTKPEKGNYAPDSDEDDDEDDDGLDNEGITDLYWEHLLEYEQTGLRRLFIGEMEKTYPDWIAMAKQSTLKADFEKAVQDCDNGWRNKVIRRWVDSLVEGHQKDLTSMFYHQGANDGVTQISMDWEEA